MVMGTRTVSDVSARSPYGTGIHLIAHQAPMKNYRIPGPIELYRRRCWIFEYSSSRENRFMFPSCQGRGVVRASVLLKRAVLLEHSWIPLSETSAGNVEQCVFLWDP